MNQKGQALVEFIVVLPVLILIIMAITDMGNILYKKYQLENDLDYIAELYKQEKQLEIESYANENNIIVSYDTNINQVTINLNKEVSVVTPGLKTILKDPYYINVKRVMYDE